MNIKCGHKSIVYPDKWPPIPKSQEWFAGHVRRTHKRTGEPVQMEVHLSELDSLKAAALALGWAFQYASHPDSDLEKGGWYRVRFAPRLADLSSELFSATEYREAMQRPIAIKRVRNRASAPTGGAATARVDWATIVETFTEYKRRNERHGHTYESAQLHVADKHGYAMPETVGRRIRRKTGMPPAAWYKTLA